MLTCAELQRRIIPFDSLRYSTEAFIDYAIPGCAPKYNYALIGPGVSQNPNQPVSLREPHGFQVGGVSMPNGTVNPPHLHFTCEVFICTRGAWELHWGFNPEPQHAPLKPGDLCSVPTWIYRGFRNVGVDDGFLFTLLGGDDTGGILWGPTALEAAAREGVLLTKDYRIVDTRRGDTLQPDETLIEPMKQEEIDALTHWTPERMATRIVRFEDLQWSSHALLDSALPGCGAELAPAIGLGMTQDRQHQAPIQNPHTASIEWLRLPPGGQVSRHRLSVKQALVCYQGAVELTIEGSDGSMQHALRGHETGWDSASIPEHHWRSLRNLGTNAAVLMVINGTDDRKRIEWSTEVVRAAAERDLALDASGYIAPRRFVERAQR